MVRRSLSNLWPESENKDMGKDISKLTPTWISDLQDRIVGRPVPVPRKLFALRPLSLDHDDLLVVGKVLGVIPVIAYQITRQRLDHEGRQPLPASGKGRQPRLLDLIRRRVRNVHRRRPFALAVAQIDAQGAQIPNAIDLLHPVGAEGTPVVVMHEAAEPGFAGVVVQDVVLLLCRDSEHGLLKHHAVFHGLHFGGGILVQQPVSFFVVQIGVVDDQTNGSQVSSIGIGCCAGESSGDGIKDAAKDVKD